MSWPPRGSTVIIGQDPGKVDDTVQTLAKDGSATGITANLADREQVEPRPLAETRRVQ